MSDYLELLPAVDIAAARPCSSCRAWPARRSGSATRSRRRCNWQQRGAEWIHLVDLDAAFGRGHNRELLAKIVGTLDIQVEMSGGIRDDDVPRRRDGHRLPPGEHRHRRPRAAGVVRARRSPTYGDRVAVGLDVRGRTLAARGWTREGGDLYDVLARLDAEGCARYVVTDVNKDGMLQGPNLELLRDVCAATDRPVVASGGHHRARRPRGADGCSCPTASRARSSAPRSTRAGSPSRTRSALTRPDAHDLAVRVIPCLDVDAGRVVKGINFQDLRDAGDPVELAKVYDAEGADELTFLDISASHEGRATTMEIVSRTAEQVFIPLTVGGGVGDVEDVDRLLRAGADKVAVNTAAIRRPELVAEIADRFGNQVLVLSVDARRAAGHRLRLRGDHPRRPAVGAGSTRSSGPRARPSWAPARSCSTRWTPTAPRTASTST